MSLAGALRRMPYVSFQPMGAWMVAPRIRILASFTGRSPTRSQVEAKRCSASRAARTRLQ
jgi:hypothetical protein